MKNPDPNIFRLPSAERNEDMSVGPYEKKNLRVPHWNNMDIVAKTAVFTSRIEEMTSVTANVHQSLSRRYEACITASSTFWEERYISRNWKLEEKRQ